MTHDHELFDNLIEQAKTLFLSKNQLAEILSVSPKSVTAWRYRYQDFPARKLGRHVRYSLPEVLQWHATKFGGQK